MTLLTGCTIALLMTPRFWVRPCHRASSLWSAAEELKQPLVHQPFFYLAHTTGSSVRFEDRDVFELDAPALQWYTDGLCLANGTPSALAAGAAATLIRGQPYCGTYAVCGMLVPPHAPQTSFFGEFVGIQSACCLAQNDPPCNIASDSDAALAEVEDLKTTGRVSRKQRHGSFWGDLELDTHGISRHSFRKVKAHRSLDNIIASPDAKDLMGNPVADRTASHIVHLFGHSSAGEAALSAKKSWTMHTKACIVRIARFRDKLPPHP
jgi:hypothetical protein